MVAAVATGEPAAQARLPQPLASDVARIEAALRPLPPARERPSLIIMVGLPGSGKSYFTRRLMESTPLVWVESDRLRKLLFGQPSYSAEESQRLFGAIHQVVRRLLASGRSVVLDATNLRERNRQRLYEIADEQGAKLLLVRLWAPAAVIKKRLEQRQQEAQREDHSEAGYEVYQRMRRRVDAIRRPHLRVNTAADTEPAIQRLMREIDAVAEDADA